MTGNFSQPKFNTDIKQSTTNLTTQLVKMQKEKYIEKGTNALNNLLKGTKNNNSANDSMPKASTPKEEIKNTVKEKASDALKGLFGGKKKKE